ncbi:hypothetical protein ECZU27_13370 [Escherichia coli]|nr:hypothetical protein ECZU27_13370 [Escherichia coli]
MRHWQMMQPLFLSLPQLRHSVPLPFQKTRVRLGRFAAFAEFPAAVAEEAALLALDDAFVSDDFAASFEAAASRAEVAASDAFVVAADAEVAADFCDAAAFVSDVFAAPALVAAALLRTLQRQHFEASVAFVDAVPALEDAD